jgi:hypothetical protein
VKILVTGGTGFIGQSLCRRLAAQGHEVIVLSRTRQKVRALFGSTVGAVENLSEIAVPEVPEVVVNLAGRSLGSARWNENSKQSFVSSRVETTEAIVETFKAFSPAPKLLISGSAVGYYGARDDALIGEEEPPGNEYQSALCRAWETAAVRAEEFGMRVCLLRSGVVLGPKGGALGSLLPAFRLGLGARLGDGQQWMPWIHIKDLIDIVDFLVRHETLSGPFNCTSPHPQRNADFARVLGETLGRPVWLRIPGWMARMQIGEMSQLMLTGQRVLPMRLETAGFEFGFPTLQSALSDILTDS